MGVGAGLLRRWRGLRLWVVHRLLRPQLKQDVRLVSTWLCHTFGVADVRRLHLEVGSGCRWPGRESRGPGLVAHARACGLSEARASPKPLAAGGMGAGALSWGKAARAGACLSHDSGVFTPGLWAGPPCPHSCGVAPAACATCTQRAPADVVSPGPIPVLLGKKLAF